MKRFIAFILIFSLSLCCTACTRKNVSLQKPAAFYYCNAEVPYDGKTGGITAEMRESANFADDMIALLNEYLKGPLAEGFLSPFPDNVRIASFNTSATTVTVVLSREFSQLSGLDLIIACACITMTCLELSDAQTIRIRAQDATLDGAEFIEMSESSLLLIDFVPSVEE